MERILIIGGCGCGKTTFAKKLSSKLDLPLVHLDTLYWRDHWENVSNEEFDEQLLRELQKTIWILDGNHNRTIPLRLSYCDTVIYMDYSSLRCVWGAFKRVIQNYGKSRPDMGGYCPERLDKGKFSFFMSVWNFNRKNRKRYYDLLNDYPDVNIIILKNRRQVKTLLQQL